MTVIFVLRENYDFKTPDVNNQDLTNDKPTKHFDPSR